MTVSNKAIQFDPVGLFVKLRWKLFLELGEGRKLSRQSVNTNPQPYSSTRNLD
jgi:hypothetical protein